MSRRMLINALEPEEVRIAVLDDGILQDYYVERESKETLVGNIYKGKVLNVHPGLQAAFVDIGIDKNAFLHASEIPGPISYDEQGRERRPMGEARQIANLVESGQEVLVQVIRDSVDAKGPSVSMDVSLPGRYLVLTPCTPRVAVSKRISDPGEREALKRLLLDLHPPEGLGFIIRTAGADRTSNDLQRDLDYLTRVWAAITRKAKSSPAPSAIYQESDLVIRTIRDMFSPEVAEIVIDQASVHNRVLEFFETLMPKFVNRVKFYVETEPLFHRYNVESQIEQIYERRVHLKSGGTIVIEPTEALVSIDVNSGKFTRETSPEEMAYRTNMEAAAEIARQLRLRDLGGQIVIDFIDMRDPRHRRNVEHVLRTSIRQDRAQATILRTSRLGLVELARQKVHAGIHLLSYEPCAHCKGSGYVKTVESVALGLLRQIRFTIPRHEVTGLKVYCNQDVAHYIVNVKRLDLEEIEKKSDKAVTVLGDREMAVECYEILCVLHGGTEVPLEEMNFKPLPPPPEPPTPVEPTEEVIEETPTEEQGVLEQRSPEPNEWQLPIEPPAGEVEEVLPAAARPIEPDFEEDASRYEERVAPTHGAEGGRDAWRSRLAPRAHRRPDASFHERRQVRRPVEEPRQPMPRQEEPAHPVDQGPRPASDEYRRGRGEYARDRDDRGGRGYDEGHEGRGREEGRGRRGHGWDRDRNDWRRRDDARDTRRPEEPRDVRGREEAPRGGRMEGNQDDEWAVEEEFDFQEPPRRYEGRERVEGRDRVEGRERGDLAFGGSTEGSGVEDERPRRRRRRRRGGRGRRRREEGREPVGYGERGLRGTDEGSGPYEGGYDAYGERQRQTPPDEDVNGWEPEGPPRMVRDEGQRGLRRDEGRGGFRRDEGRGGYRRDEGRVESREDEERGGYRRDEGCVESRQDEGRGGFRRDEARSGARRPVGDEGRVEPREDEGRVRAPRPPREEGRRGRAPWGGREEGRGDFRRDAGHGGRAPWAGREEGSGGFHRDEEHAPEEPQPREQEEERLAVQGREAAEPMVDRGLDADQDRGGRGGPRRGGRDPFRREEGPPRKGHAPIEPTEPVEVETKRRDEPPEVPPTMERQAPHSGHPEPPSERLETEPAEAAPPAPAPEAAVPPEEEVGVGFRRKTTGRRRATKRRTSKTRGGLGAALDSEGEEGKTPPAE